MNNVSFLGQRVLGQVTVLPIRCFFIPEICLEKGHAFIPPNMRNNGNLFISV
jgi:hypothetical protein